MKWQEAKKLLEEGKKIRRDSWNPDSYINGTDPVLYRDGSQAFFTTRWTDATNWELYTEAKSDAEKELSKTSRKMQQKINCYRNENEKLRNSNLKRKAQNTKDHDFVKLMKKYSPDAYDKAVAETEHIKFEEERNTLSDARATADAIISDDVNPAHFCMGCDKYIGHRGFCSQKCHDKHYDAMAESEVVEPTVEVTPEENNTLSDTIRQEKVFAEDVKEGLGKLVGWANGKLVSVYDLKDKIKEIFGKRCM